MRPEDRSTPDPRPLTLRAFCLRVLENGDLASKLAPPTTPDGTLLPDSPSGPAVEIDRPARDPGLRMTGGSDRLPRPGQLQSPEHRRLCLARFAHHELMAVELFAWALLRWPQLPAALRRGLASALADEQRHCQLYLDRLADQGGEFRRDDHSDYFWQQAATIAASPAGPRAFLAGMGLTLEQANLDFTLTYRDGFAEAGDAESAAVCQTVHDDEIAHVALAARWLVRLDDTGAERDPDRPLDLPQAEIAADARDPLEEARDLEAYLATVPFPLGPARAKGRRFEVAPRRRAGLSEELIEHVRSARSSQERGLRS